MVNGECSAIIGGSSNSIIGSNVLGSCIYGGNTNVIDASRFSTIIGGIGNSIAPEFNNSFGNCIVASNSHSMIRQGNFNVRYNCMLGGHNSSITSSQDCVVLGSNISCLHNACFLFSDDAGGTQLSSTANNQFRARCTGGATFFTNTTNTTGVTLAAGGSSWGVVSDVNSKENMLQVDYQSLMDKVNYLLIYEYNYIGNDPKQKCFGPTAQDWHTQFPCETITTEILDLNGDSVLDEFDLPTFEEVDAKNQLVIEVMDMLGVALACIKNLNQRIQVLEAV